MAVVEADCAHVRARDRAVALIDNGVGGGRRGGRRLARLRPLSLSLNLGLPLLTWCGGEGYKS